LVKPQKSSLKTNLTNSVRMGKELCFLYGVFRITRLKNCLLLPSNGHQSMMTFLLFQWVLMTFQNNHMDFWYFILWKILHFQLRFRIITDYWTSNVEVEFEILFVHVWKHTAPSTDVQNRLRSYWQVFYFESFEILSQRLLTN